MWHRMRLGLRTKRSGLRVVLLRSGTRRQIVRLRSRPYRRIGMRQLGLYRSRMGCGSSLLRSVGRMVIWLGKGLIARRRIGLGSGPIGDVAIWSTSAAGLGR